VTASPATVGASAYLTFTTKLANGGYYNTGDTLTYTVPSPGSFTAGTGATLCVSVSLN